MSERVDVAIVGGGIAGLALAWQLRQRAPGMSVRVLEAGDRVGGKVLSHRVATQHGDFLIEAGPDSLLTQKPEALALVHELGLSDQLIPVATGLPTAILHRGRPELMPRGMRLVVPTEIAPFRASPLLSFRGKERALLDLQLPPRESDDDESLADFVRRRFGQEMVDRLAEPILAGIHNGDPERLSLRATFPQLAQLERRHGSLIVGMRSVQASNGGPAFVALRNGMDSLVVALAQRLAGAIQLNAPVAALARTTETFELTLENGARVLADRVVLSTSATVSAELTRGVAPTASHILRQFTTNHAGSISLAVRDCAVMRPLPGFGLVIPRSEGRAINAITVASRKFAGRAPQGWTLLRVFFGGARSPHTMELDDEALLSTVRHELRDLLGIEESPLFARITRWQAGNPQYDVGHLDRVAELEASLPGDLFLIGSAYRGVGIPDLVRGANTVAERLTRTPDTRSAPQSIQQ